MLLVLSPTRRSDLKLSRLMRGYPDLLRDCIEILSDGKNTLTKVVLMLLVTPSHQALVALQVQRVVGVMHLYQPTYSSRGKNLLHSGNAPARLTSLFPRVVLGPCGSFASL